MAVSSGGTEKRAVIDGERAEGRVRKEALLKDWQEGVRDKHNGS